MKNFITSTFFLFFLMQSSISFGQWEEVLIPELSLIQAVHFSNELVVRAVEEKIYYTREGEFWLSMEYPDSQGTFNAVFSKDERIFSLRTNERSVFFTDDFGQTWVQVPFAFPEDLRQFHAYGNYFYALAKEKMYRSSDEGKTWDLIFQENDQAQYTLINKNNLLFALTKEGIFKSDDLGTTWNFMKTPVDSFVNTTSTYTHQLRVDRGIFYVSNLRDTLDEIFKSMDDGLTWEYFSNTEEMGFSYFHPIDITSIDNSIFAVSTNKITSSNDNGATWMNYPVPGNPVKLFEKGNKLLLQTAFDFYTKNKNVSNWKTVLTGVSDPKPFGSPTNFYSLSHSDDNLHLVTDEGIYRHLPDGINWEVLNPDLVESMFHTRMLGDTLFGLSNSSNINSQPINFYRSYNQGEDLETLSLPDSVSRVLGFVIHKKALFLLVKDFSQNNFLLFSNDFGETWADNGSADFFIDNQNPAKIAANKSSLFLYNSSNISISNDKGLTFNSLFNGSLQPSVRNLLVSDDLILVVDSQDSVFEITDTNWERHTNLSGAMDYNYADMLSDEDYHLIFGRDYMLLSKDGGKSWDKFETPIDLAYSRRKSINDGVLYVVTSPFEPSILKLDLSKLKNVTLKGNVFHDKNKTGIQDPNEEGLPDILLETRSSNNVYASDQTGVFSIFTPVTNEDTLIAILPNIYAEVTTPPIPFSTSIDQIKFGIYFPPDIKDLGVDFSTSNPFVPGFDRKISIKMKNHGTTTTEGKLKVLLPDDLTLISASPEETNRSGDTLIWEGLHQEIFQGFSVELMVTLPPSAMIGEQIEISSFVETFGFDQNILNNEFSQNYTIVGSYDPNDKRVSKTSLTPAEAEQQETLEYTIRFQNTGNYPATFIHIIDTLDAQLDKSTLKVLATSHPMELNLTETGALDFFFDQIHLPDSSSNQLASNGFIKFSIKPNPGLMLNDEIENRAAIYFDYNPPIFTNTVGTKVELPFSSVETNISEQILKIYPNPSSEEVRVKLDLTRMESAKRIILTNELGIKIWELNAFNSSEIELPKLPQGVYFVLIESETGITSERLLIID